MAERPDAYFRKNPGDVIQSNEWNELQVKAREEIRAHRHTGNEDGSLIPRAGIEPGAIDGKLIDPAAELNVRTLTTSGNLTVKGELAVNGKALLGDIADLLATVKGLQDDKLNRRGDTVGGTLRVQRNLLVDGRVGVGTSDACTKLEVIGGALISNGSGFAVQANYMASGSLTIGGTSTGYGGGRGWGSSTAGLLLETKGTTEIAVHDAGTRLASLLYYNDNRITIGRDMGWSVTPLIVAGNMGIGTTTPTQKLVVEADHNSGKDVDTGLSYGGQLAIRSNTPQIDFINTASRQLDWAIMVNDGSMHFIREPWLSNLVLAANGNVGIGTITPSQRLTVEALHNASRDPDSGLLYGGQLAIRGNVCQLDFIIPNQAAWAIHVNSLNKMHFVRPPWNASDLVLDGSGKIGIGTDSPAQQLTITGGLGFANQNAGDKKLHSPKDGLLEWMTNDAAGDPGFAVSHQGEARVYLSTDGNSFLNGGNVGIGTATPSRTLQIGPDVDGLGFELAQRASPNVGVLRFGDNTGWKLHFGRSREVANGELNSGLAGVLMTIKDNGDIGIGTTAPNQKLVVEGGHNSGRDPDSALLYGGQLAIKSNACQIDFIDTDPGHDDWAIMVNGGKMHFIKEPWTYTNLVLAANGNVGIGTDNPAQQLTITGGIGFANQNAGDKKLHSPRDGLLEWMTNDAAGDHAFAVSHQGQARVYLSTNGNSYLNGGNVGLGTTAPREKLEVAGNLNVSGEIIRKVSMATALGPDEQTDNGPIASRVLNFVKRYAETAIRIIYSDNFRVNGNNVAARWEIRIDGAIPPGGAIYQDKYGSSGNYHEPGVIMGYARGIAAGAHVIGVWVSTPPGYVVCDAYTGWGSSRWTLEAQEVWL